MITDSVEQVEVLKEKIYETSVAAYKNRKTIRV